MGQKFSFSIEAFGLHIGTDGVGFNKKHLFTFGSHIQVRYNIYFYLLFHYYFLSHFLYKQYGNFHEGGTIGWDYDNNKLAVDESIGVIQTFHSNGSNLVEWIENFRAEGGLLDHEINYLQHYQKELLVEIGKVVHLDAADLTHFTVEGTLSTGVKLEVGAAVEFGLPDAEGYDMIGAEFEIGVVGLSVEAGWNIQQEKVKAIVKVDVEFVNFEVVLYFSKKGDVTKQPSEQQLIDKVKAVDQFVLTAQAQMATQAAMAKKEAQVTMATQAVQAAQDKVNASQIALASWDGQVQVLPLITQHEQNVQALNNAKALQAAMVAQFKKPPAKLITHKILGTNGVWSPAPQLDQAHYDAYRSFL